MALTTPSERSWCGRLHPTANWHNRLSHPQKYEGVRGFYKGFWINALNVVSGAFYIVTYENVRHLLQSLNVADSRIRALVGGGCASLVGQTIIVPFDIISQRLMIMGQVRISSSVTSISLMTFFSNDTSMGVQDQLQHLVLLLAVKEEVTLHYR